MSEIYRTVGERGEAAFEERGSRFIGYIAPAETVGDAEAFVAAIENEHPDASHNVPAYRVRADPLREYASDDGEPGGSAGKPALTVLEREEIENVAAVVTRYYGGTNLGVGGLARAYGRAVKLALDDAGTVEQRPHERLRLAVDYDDSGTVRGILESSDVDFEAEYEERASFAVRVPSADAAELRERLLSATSGRAELESDDGE
ncbi:IMPACT family protein [Halococcus dombrowskii]|uniref:IMPACT family protein n=1 Tax=Halococcus dombrowskii TaxID=179637 RepID=A0AAV3SN01_HALDO|nr:YigZ family protein [Halococcus dombrowskii]UOO95474.1 IMPACT family protein [Halococcus dombrowskii]